MAMIEPQLFTSADCIIRFLSNLIKLAWKKQIEHDVIKRARIAKHGRGGAAGFLVTVSGMARRDPAESLYSQ